MTVNEMVRLIAQLWFFFGRMLDGAPGVKTIGKGLNQVHGFGRKLRAPTRKAGLNDLLL